MSIQDTATKQYVSEAGSVCRRFNYLIYDGEQVIKPEQLTDMDTTQYVIPYHEDEKGKPEAAQKYRDTLKTLAVKTDDRYTYLVLGNRESEPCALCHAGSQHAVRCHAARKAGA